MSTALRLIDYIIDEPEGGAHNNPDLVAENISCYLTEAFKRNLQKPIDELLNDRYTKFRKVGEFEETHD